jgi:Zn-dependent peptidase ImmA (M78 family)
LPITTARTDRQKFQRAFAAEFLLPFQEMCEQLGGLSFGEGEIRDDDIEDVAAQYQVSPLMVRTSLVNRGVLPREALGSAA